MGTRGALGFYKGGEHKVTYNHFDSYLDGLGNNVLGYVNSKTIEGLNAAFDNIELINDENEKPTPKQLEKCKEFVDLNVAGQSIDDWYCVLRKAQGNLDAYAKVGVMIDSRGFLNDSLFCEYAYIINLDDNVLEVYRGFQRNRPEGRYADYTPERDSRTGQTPYYAVGLKKIFPLDDCPQEFTEEIIKEILGEEDDE